MVSWGGYAVAIAYLKQHLRHVCVAVAAGMVQRRPAAARPEAMIARVAISPPVAVFMSMTKHHESFLYLDALKIYHRSTSASPIKIYFDCAMLTPEPHPHSARRPRPLPPGEGLTTAWTVDWSRPVLDRSWRNALIEMAERQAAVLRPERRATHTPCPARSPAVIR